MTSNNLLGRLIEKGDIVSIKNGELVIQPASGKEIPCGWLSENGDQLLREVVKLLGVTALKYESYSTGNYVDGRGPGITLQFNNMLREEDSYAIFNVYLHRARNNKAGKKGTQLPKGQFRVGRKSRFYQFWQRTGLKLAPRPSSFHDYMGNLKKMVFTGEYRKNEKLVGATLRPLNVTHAMLLSACNLYKLPYKPQTTHIQLPDNRHTSLPYKDFLEAQLPQGIQSNLATGESNHGISKQGDANTGVNVTPINTHKKPEDQTTEEWLMDYESEYTK